MLCDSGYEFLNLLLLALTGFAQMPIFKRYYIADIPGLGWLAKFYVTHYLHYLAAVLFFGLLAYIIADHVLNGPVRQKRVSLSGAVRGLILMAVVIPGIFLVVRNLSGYTFSPDFIIFSGHWPPLVFNGGAVLPSDQKGLDNRSSTTYE